MKKGIKDLFHPKAIIGYIIAGFTGFVAFSFGISTLELATILVLLFIGLYFVDKAEEDSKG